MKKKTYYVNSPICYCSECKHAHHTLSGIGRKHIKYAKKEIQKDTFIKYKIY